ncbi:uncharacterized protein A4U43_C02F18210 [Asparagus officinalis]|uniref:Uncharacterized protein n=1 Tax=Asparagus officinalis TaxID=4686 RepID=A0A5P1FKX8_ASPOF|nr:uncharacterized protein A4U43_C02F18210 [Asparagus officinalis]
MESEKVNSEKEENKELLSPKVSVKEEYNNNERERPSLFERVSSESSFLFGNFPISFDTVYMVLHKIYALHENT